VHRRSGFWPEAGIVVDEDHDRDCGSGRADSSFGAEVIVEAAIAGLIIILINKQITLRSPAAHISRPRGRRKKRPQPRRAGPQHRQTDRSGPAPIQARSSCRFQMPEIAGYRPTRTPIRGARARGHLGARGRSTVDRRRLLLDEAAALMLGTANRRRSGPAVPRPKGRGSRVSGAADHDVPPPGGAPRVRLRIADPVPFVFRVDLAPRCRGRISASICNDRFVLIRRNLPVQRRGPLVAGLFFIFFFIAADESAPGRRCARCGWPGGATPQ